jgi:predicted S18 family serine protease
MLARGEAFRPSKLQYRTRETIFAGVLLLAAAGAARAQTVSCPASITVLETVQAPAGWQSGAVKAVHKFERVSIFNGKQGGQEYDLAPDDEKGSGRAVVQTWFLKDYRSMNLFMRCRYRGTEATLAIDLPPPLETCTFTFELRKDGAIIGEPTAVCR